MHVGLFGLKTLKMYLTLVKHKRENDISQEIVRLSKAWTKEKSNIISSTEPTYGEEINRLFDSCVSSRGHRCDVVVYQRCSTCKSDPMYRFRVHSTEDYASKFDTLQIDYYNTCLTDRTSVELEHSYQNIAEHYLIENSISKIFLKPSSNDLGKDPYMLRLIDLLKTPSETVSVQFLYRVVRTKQGRVSEEPETELKDVIEVIIDELTKVDAFARTKITNHNNKEVESIDKLRRFTVIFYWSNTEHTSSIYVTESTKEHTEEPPAVSFDPTNGRTKNVTDWILKNYHTLRDLTNPC